MQDVFLNKTAVSKITGIYYISYSSNILSMHSIQSQHGFLLTQQALDISTSPQIQLWLSTDNGPVKLNIDKQQPLFFIKESDLAQSQEVLLAGQVQYQAKKLPMTTFDQEQIFALYFRNIKQSRSANYLLKQVNIISFESDFRLDQRYLMERFICGGIEFSGTPRPQQDYCIYDQVKIRPSDYTPKLTVLSLDIECSQSFDVVQ